MLFYVMLLSNSTIKAIELPKVKRLAGANRYETSIEISKHGWQNSEYAIIAASENYVDALCATSLSYKYNAPMLFTAKDKLNTNIESQLLNLKVKTVFIIGSEEFISNKIDLRLSELNIKSERIYGSNRTETSILIARKLETKTKYFITYDEDFKDIMFILPTLLRREGVVVLVNEDNYDEIIKKLLKDNNSAEISIICNNKKKDKQFDNLSYNYNIKYEDYSYLKNESMKVFNCKDIYFISNEDFCGTLSTLIVAAMNKSIMVPITLLNDKDIEKFLIDRIDSLNKIIAIGGYMCIPDYLIQDLYKKAGEYTLINTRKYILEKVIGVENVGADIAKDIQMEIDIGTLNNSLYQEDSKIEVYGKDIKDIKVFNDKDDNYKAIVKIPYFKHGQSEEFRVTRVLKNSGIKYNTQIKNTGGDYRGFKEYKKYTSAECNIESDNIAIISKAKELTMNEVNPYNKAKIIYEFVNTNLIYDTSEGNKGAINAITTRKGVCEEFATLFVAMCRAVGIPSRVVYGNWVPLENISTVDSDIKEKGHVWAEFYLPEYGWIVVEPTKQINDSKGRLIPNFDYFTSLPVGDHFIEHYSKPKLRVTINSNDYLGVNEGIKFQEKECYIREIKN